MCPAIGIRDWPSLQQMLPSISRELAQSEVSKPRELGGSSNFIW